MLSLNNLADCQFANRIQSLTFAKINSRDYVNINDGLRKSHS